MTGHRRSSGVLENLASSDWGCGGYSRSYSKNYSCECLSKRPARPAITTDRVKLPARLPAPHVVVQSA
jgi:hypothetical protein